MKRVLVAAALSAAALATPALAQFSGFNPAQTYPNPDAALTNGGRGNPCNDPWVSIALRQVYGVADPADCAPTLYNGGQWGSYNELVHAVAATRAVFAAGGADLKGGYLGNPGMPAVGLFVGGRLVGAGAGNLVAAPANQLVGAGAGNLVGAGAGNLVGAGAGNLTFVPEGPAKYSLSSANAVKLPQGALKW